MSSLVLLAALHPSARAEDLELWGGAAASSGVVYSSATNNVGAADPVTTQVELDGAIGWGWGHARVDLDAHFDLNALDGGEVFTYPSPWPEWGMVQLGREAVHVRAGLLNPDIGLEDWDPWVNYAPTYSTTFVYAGAGRFLGLEPSYTTTGGVDLFAFGGYDVDWESFGGGLGVATLQDAYSTWSGVVVYPSFLGDYCPDGEACLNAVAAVAVEVYPADPVWVALDSATGIRDTGFYSSNQLVVNVIPEAVVNPFVRGEFLLDPDGVLGAPDATASLGARTDAIEWLRVALELKATIAGDVTDLGGALVIAAHVPEPSPYSYQDPFGEEEEE